MYKEDFEGERSDRAKAHGMMDEIRSKHQEEKVKMEDQIRRLQKELHTAQEEVDTHKYSRELAEKTHQRKEHEMTAALAVTEKAKEETKTKALQVTQYKKQVDQLQDQVTIVGGTCTYMYVAVRYVTGRNLHKRMLSSLLCTQRSSLCNVSVARDLLQVHTVQ